MNHSKVITRLFCHSCVDELKVRDFTAKTKWMGLLLLLVISGCFSRGTGSAVTRELDLTEITAAIYNCTGWALEKDTALLYSIIAKDSTFLEVHPQGKVVKGFKEFKEAEAIWLNPSFKALRFEISDLTIQFSESGSVAWWFCILDDINEWQGKPSSWLNTRWTGVLEKRCGKWLIVQQHFSFAS